MIINYSQQVNDFKSGIEESIPAEKYRFICSCIYCWNYSKVNTCKKCDKLFCLNHTNHMCFKEPTISISDITLHPESMEVTVS